MVVGNFTKVYSFYIYRQTPANLRSSQNLWVINKHWGPGISIGLKTSSEPVQCISGTGGTIPAPSFLHLVHQERSPNKGMKRGQTWPYPFNALRRSCVCKCVRKRATLLLWKPSLTPLGTELASRAWKSWVFCDTSQWFLERGCTGLVQGSTQRISLLLSSPWVVPCRTLRPHFRPPAVYSFLQDACQALYIWFNRLTLCLSLRSPQFNKVAAVKHQLQLWMPGRSAFSHQLHINKYSGLRMFPTRPEKPPGDNCGTR